MKLVRLLPPLLLLSLTTGCATVLHGTRQNVRVETDPPGATASAGGQTVTTPGVLKLHRKETNLEVVVEKEGYVSVRVPLARQFDVPYPGDLVLTVSAMVGAAVTKSWFGAIGLPVAAVGVDIATGANYRIEPSKIFLRLEPVVAFAMEGEEREGEER
jgi:hypothetical protein